MSEIIYGKNSVYEYLKSQDAGKKIILQNNHKKDKFKDILSLAKKKNIKVENLDKKDLDKLTDFGNHQGVVLEIEDYQYADLEEILEIVSQKDDSILMILDEITDPHNLGAIIRTAEAGGLDAVIIPKHRSAEVNATVHKTSAGATSFMKVARVTNVNQTIEKLKEAGYWVYGADGHTDKSYDQIDYSGKTCLVIGNEGRGISKKTKEKCDDLVKIPMIGQTESLNASISAAVLIYGALLQKKHKF